MHGSTGLQQLFAVPGNGPSAGLGATRGARVARCMDFRGVNPVVQPTLCGKRLIVYCFRVLEQRRLASLEKTRL